MNFKELINAHYSLNEGKLNKSEADFVKRHTLPRNANAEQISKGIRDTSPVKRIFSVLHPNSTIDHVNALINDPEPSVRSALMDHPLITEDHLTHIFKNDNNTNVISAALDNPKVHSGHLDILLKDMPGTARNYEQYQHNSKVLQHEKLTPAQISHVFASKDFNEDQKQQALWNKNSQEEHVSSALRPGYDENMAMNAFVHPKLTSEHIHQYINNNVIGESPGQDMISSRAFNSSHIDALLKKTATGDKDTDYHNGYPTGWALQSKHATYEQIKSGTKHSNPIVQEHAKLAMKKFS